MFGDGFDPVEADREQLEHLPGLAELFEADCPGMHRTQSIDYDIVVEGRIWLELDDGTEVELHAGDVAVQQGNRHAWRNKRSEEHTSELQSLMRISYAVFCLKKKKKNKTQ